MPQIPTRDWLELPGTLATCSLASGKAPRGHRSWVNPPVTTGKAQRGGARPAPGTPAFTLREQKQLPRVLVKRGWGPERTEGAASPNWDNGSPPSSLKGKQGWLEEGGGTGVLRD